MILPRDKGLFNWVHNHSKSLGASLGSLMMGTVNIHARSTKIAGLPQGPALLHGLKEDTYLRPVVILDSCSRSELQPLPL